MLVIDSGRPRNAPAAHAHGYLTRDGVAPAQLLAEGRAEVTGYGGEIVTGNVVAAERLDDGDFRVVLEDGPAVTAHRLLVTTGLVDELPDVPGVAERWGREVLHCPYCHGWEVRDQPVAVLATGPLSVHQALMWRQWSKDVTFFLHTAPEPGDEEYEQLAAREIAVVDGRVAGLEVTDDRLTGVTLEDGKVFPCRAAVVAPRFTARAGFLTTLGLEATEQKKDGHVIGSYVAADATGATAVPGVWVAGNVTNLTEQVVGAAGAGVRAGAALNEDLIAEETRRAVAARAGPGDRGRPYSSRTPWGTSRPQGAFPFAFGFAACRTGPPVAVTRTVRGLPRRRPAVRHGAFGPGHGLSRVLIMPSCFAWNVLYAWGPSSSGRV